LISHKSKNFNGKSFFSHRKTIQKCTSTSNYSFDLGLLPLSSPGSGGACRIIKLGPEKGRKRGGKEGKKEGRKAKGETTKCCAL
jgi:hypothetical protein